MLHQMCDEDDVREYADGGVKKVHIRRLLEWLARIRSDQAQRSAALEVNFILSRASNACRHIMDILLPPFQF